MEDAVELDSIKVDLDTDDGPLEGGHRESDVTQGEQQAFPLLCKY